MTYIYCNGIFETIRMARRLKAGDKLFYKGRLIYTVPDKGARK